jgi:hypothetical protein
MVGSFTFVDYQTPQGARYSSNLNLRGDEVSTVTRLRRVNYIYGPTPVALPDATALRY